MNASEKLTAIRQLITQANNEAAAQQLLQYLDAQPTKIKAWQDEVRNLLAQYQRAKRGQRTNTVSFEDAQRSINKITDSLLRIVNKIEQGIPPAPVVVQRMNYRWLSIGVLLALGISLGTFFFLRSGENTTPPTDPMDNTTLRSVVSGEVGEKCPVYPVESPFNILILPFFPLDGQPENVATALRIRLAERMEKYGVEGSVFTKMMDVNSPRYPVNTQMARQLGRPCKAQLIVWGTTEKNASTEELITTTKFRFIESDNFRLTDLAVGVGTTIDTVSSLSSIATSGELTKDIEQSLRLIFGLISHETGHHAIAAEELQPVIDSLGGVTKAPKWGLIQADSYILSGQEEKALEIYRKMAQKDTANVQALINKSALEWQQGNRTVALQDLDRTIEQDPQNTTARTNRARARVAQHDVAKARMDIELLEKKGTNPATLEKIRTELKVVEAEEEAKYREAEQKLESNPDDTSAWRAKAVSAANLGRYDMATLASERLLSVDPTNETATSTLKRVAPLQIDSTQLPTRRLRPNGG